jgi:hypothetical protein
VLVAALSAAGVASSPPASAAFSCTGVLTHDVNGPLIVPSGVTCEILGSWTVNGSITVQPGGRLLLSNDGALIKGSVNSDRAGSSAPNNPYGYSFSILICNTHITGSVNVTRATDNVVIGDSEDHNACYSNRVDSSVNLSNNTGGVELNNDPASTGCTVDPCRIAGSVNVNYNTGFAHDDERAAEVDDNTINGSLNCKGNAGIAAFGNTVAGVTTGQCAA